MKYNYSHAMTHDAFTGRWSCKCGYVLGDGREAFLAPCPLRKQRTQSELCYPEFKISEAKKKTKPRKKKTKK